MLEVFNEGLRMKTLETLLLYSYLTCLSYKVE